MTKIILLITTVISPGGLIGLRVSLSLSLCSLSFGLRARSCDLHPFSVLVCSFGRLFVRIRLDARTFTLAHFALLHASIFWYIFSYVVSAAVAAWKKKPRVRIVVYHTVLL